MRHKIKIRASKIAVITLTALLAAGLSAMNASADSIYGSHGTEVVSIQQRLIKLGYYDGNVDGSYGPATKNAVIAFQNDNGLYPDGCAGSNTLAALGIDGNSAVPETEPEASAKNNTANISSPLFYGSRGSEVVILQQKLKELGYFIGMIDGVFGDYTKSAVKLFQLINGLDVDGMAGPATVAVINDGGKANNTPSAEEGLTQAQSLAIHYNNLTGNSLYNSFILASLYSYRVHDVSGTAVNDIPEICAVHYFLYQNGDCFDMAAAFCQMASALGYDAHQVIGVVPYRNGTVGAHSWVEIDVDGDIEVYDPDFHNQYGYGGWNFSYGDSGTWMYSATIGRIN